MPRQFRQVAGSWSLKQQFLWKYTTWTEQHGIPFLREHIGQPSFRENPRCLDEINGFISRVLSWQPRTLPAGKCRRKWLLRGSRKLPCKRPKAEAEAGWPRSCSGFLCSTSLCCKLHSRRKKTQADRFPYRLDLLFIRRICLRIWILKISSRAIGMWSEEASRKLFTGRKLETVEKKGLLRRWICQRNFFNHETRILRLVRHRNIVRIAGQWIIDGYGYILTEYIEGGTLIDVLHRRKPLVLNWYSQRWITLGIAEVLLIFIMTVCHSSYR